MKMNAVLLFPPSGSLEERSASPPPCSFTYSTEYGDVPVFPGVSLVICSTHFTFSSFSSTAFSAVREKLKELKIAGKKRFSSMSGFLGGFDTIDLAGRRYESRNDPIL